MDNGVVAATPLALTTNHYGSSLKPLPRTRKRGRDRERPAVDTLPPGVPLAQTNSLFIPMLLSFFFTTTVWTTVIFLSPRDARSTGREKLIIADGFLLLARCAVTLTECLVDRRAKYVSIRAYYWLRNILYASYLSIRHCCVDDDLMHRISIFFPFLLSDFAGICITK